MIKNKFVETYILIIGSCLILSSCSTNPPSSSPSKETVQKYVIEKNPEVGCLSLTENYCKSLYGNTSLGNLEVIRPAGNISVLQGETSNDFSQQFFSYSKAKLKGKERLPKIFIKILEELSYFKKLNDLLSRAPRPQMTLSERIHFDRLSTEVDSLWDMALEETVVRRLALRYPNFHKIRSREMPPEFEIEYQKERSKLHNQVALALWHDDKNWSKVEATFRKLQDSFLNVIDRLQVENSIKEDFKNRIKTLKLVLPGSSPEVADSDCSSTMVNAFYYKYLNVITVCAGDFNSEDILQTLAHEMSHALDFSRSVYNYKMNSKLVQFQKTIRTQVCEEKQIDCKSWSDFKQNLPGLLASYSVFTPPLKEFNQCLKRRSDTKSPSEEDYQRIARTNSTDIFSSLAGSDYFLRITKDKLPLRNGKSMKNPYYLNPCKYYHWTNNEEPPEDEINSLVYFTAEYMCVGGDQSEKFKSALDVSKKITESVIAQTLKTSGEFSGDSAMVDEGFSSPSNERFADVFGSYAIKEYLKMFSSIEDRRGKFLASMSWLCSEPSLKSHFPKESLIQSEYEGDSHTSGTMRVKEILAQPIRSSLNCRKDFEDNECVLPIN